MLRQQLTLTRAWKMMAVQFITDIGDVRSFYYDLTRAIQFFQQQQLRVHLFVLSYLKCTRLIACFHRESSCMFIAMYM